MLYFAIGALWCWWLEYYTTGNANLELNGSWSWRERFFHTLLWPFSLGTFIYEFFRNIF